MSAGKNLDSLYSIGNQLSADPLLSVFSARIDPETFDYATLYACAQVRANTPVERETGIEHFLGKIREKNLDRETIRTILETQDARLPEGDLLLMRGGDLVSYQYFEAHLRHFLYQNHPVFRAVFDAGFSGGAPACLCEQIRGALDRDAVLALSFPQKLEVARQAAQAVELLHRQGLAHGALRPAQFSVLREGETLRVRLTALGMIPDLEGALMAGGELKEFFCFCSPRQLSGERPAAADDLYALGAYLYFLLTGKEPWAERAGLPELLEALKNGGEPFDRQELELLPQEAQAVILAAAAPDGRQQYSGVGQLISDLEACGNEQPVLAFQLLQTIVVAKDAPAGVPEAPSPAQASALVREGGLFAGQPAAQPASVSSEARPVASADTGEHVPQNSEDVVPAGAGGSGGAGGWREAPLFAEARPREPEIVNITDMSAGMNRVGRNTMLKVVATVGVLAVCAGVGYYFSGPGRTAQQGGDNPVAADPGSLASDPNAPQVGVAGVPAAGAQPTASGTSSATAATVAELLGKGNFAMQAKDYAGAVQAFAELNKLQPTMENAGLLQAAQAGSERAQKREASLALAQQLLAAGNLDAAETTLLGILSMPGYAQDAQALALQKTVQEKRFQTALAEGTKLLEQKDWKAAASAFAWALSIRGYENDPQALRGKQQAEESLARSEEVLRKQEQEKAQRRSSYNLALASARQLEQAGRWEEAASAYGVALGVDGFSTDAAALSGRDAAQRKAQEKKDRLTQRKAAALKARYEALLERGRLYLQARQWAKAEDAFAQAGNLDGYAGSALAQEGRTQAIQGSAADSDRVRYDNLLLDGMKQILQKKYDEADATFRNALKVKGFESGVVARQLLMFAGTMKNVGGKADEYADHLRQGDALLAQNKPEEAALEYGRALVADPAQTDPLLRRGMAYLKANNEEKALSSFKQALEKQPGLAAGLAGEAATLLRQEKYDAALEDLDQIENGKDTEPVLKAWAQGARGWLLFNPIGRGLRRPGIEADNDKAVTLLRQAAEAGDAEALNNLAVAYWRGKGTQRDEKQALELLERSAKASCPAAQFNLGLYYYTSSGAQRDYPKAAECFRLAAEGGFLRAYGRLADLYQRGRGVEKDAAKAKEYADKYGGRTDREDDPALASPSLGFYRPAAPAAQNQQVQLKNELADQFGAVMDEGRKLLQKQQIASARRLFTLAQLVPGYESNPEVKAGMDAAQKASDDLDRQLAAIPELPSLEVKDEAPVAAVTGQAPTSPTDPVIPDLAAPGTPGTPATPANPVAAGQAPVTPVMIPAKPPVPGVTAQTFAKEYAALLAEAKAQMARGNWGIAGQAYRLASVLPGIADIKEAEAGIVAAQVQKQKMIENGTAKFTDFEAVLASGSDALRDRFWQQAQHFFQYAQSLEGRKGDPVAVIGADVSARTAAAVTAAQHQPQPEQRVAAGAEVDTASYKVALTQAQDFLTQKNYSAAAQLAKIILGMKGFENDSAAQAVLSAAQTGIALEQNSPEARQINRTKNAKLYEELMLAGKMHIANQDWDKAQKALETALKLPGYVDEPETKQLLAAAKEHRKPGDNNPGKSAAGNNPLADGFINPDTTDPKMVERRAEFEAVMREARRLFELKQYEAAEAIAGEALKVPGYESNPEALQLQVQAKALKPKPEEIKVPKAPDALTQEPAQDMKQQSMLLLREGDRLRAEKNLPGAIQAYSSGIDLDPENVQLRINRGDTLAASGQFSQALMDYEKGLKVSGIESEQQNYIYNNIANVYYYGMNEPGKAVEYYRRAATDGNPAAMNSLGVCYGSGAGVAKDPSQALQWYKEAAGKEYANAMLNLGLAYQNGWGTTVDNQQAFHWYEEAAKRNVPRAFQRLAIMYREGLGIEKDEAKAAENEKKARALGYNQTR